ncbi:MAG: histidine kinase [Micrococcales bacterium]|nr:histidine kinase [Micrococcales bacterium]
MAGRLGGLGARMGAAFGFDDPWERERPPVGRLDWVLVGFFLLLAIAGLELTRGFMDYEGARPRWLEYLAVVSYVVPLAFRRRWPVPLGLYVGAHWLFFGNVVPEVSVTLSMQIAYFFGIFSVVAWARDRRTAALTVGFTVLVLLGWVAWGFAVGRGLEDMWGNLPDVEKADGMLPPLTSAVLYSFLLNIVYFAGAVFLGLAAWWQARNRAQLADQATTIAAQADELADQAVVQERLRIARELHDVVAHHVSVMGVQAAAARRVLERDPDAARSALGHVEESSRQAVGEMRGLLGTLRGTAGQEAESRGPEPTVTELDALVESFRQPGFRVSYDLVEDEPGATGRLPLPVSLSLYRTVQESLANVRRHSSATSASVVLRVGRDQAGPRYAEVEVLDSGRPRGGTSGTGLGLLGLRERISSHGGTAEIGPRLTGGYRVRVRFPLKAFATDEESTDRAS